ncbi:MAG: protein-glutamate O-methyltransferase CheR [Synergistaceae bacterium]|nr:protein-glutamate O-methyltransferase CheR [Synergistaceae bacterium]
MLEKNYPAPPEYDRFKSDIQRLTGIDLNGYKYQIHRRVHMLMQRWGLNSYEDYFKLIRDDTVRQREFLDYITINVSEFFRNPQRWWELRDTVIPHLISLRKNKRIRLWSAGSATGEEPYSLAILAAHLGLESKVLAMDIDHGAIEKAREAIYNIRQIAGAPEDWKKRYFTQIDEERVQVNPEIRQRVEFKRGNLIEDSFEEKAFDLILCRNVVIYFSPETKSKLYKKFFNAIRPGGYLMVGATEQIFEYRSLGFRSAGPFLYERPE